MTMNDGCKILIWATALGLVINLLGCTIPVDIETEPTPVLQVDATFFANEQFPIIQIRQSFNVTGSEQFFVDTDTLWAKEATVMLHRNEQTVPVFETAPGRFRTVDTTKTARAGDAVEIQVSWQGLTAHAVANVPTFQLNDFELTMSDVTTERGIPLLNFLTEQIDTLDVYYANVTLTQTNRPDVELIQMASLAELNLETMYGRVHSIIDYHSNPEYQLFIADAANDDNLTATRKTLTYISSGSVSRTISFSVRVITVVAEAVYGDFVRTRSDFFTPVRVSNVDNGVGLFIGASRDTLWFNQNIE
jgi:hypothetical protein